MQKIKYAIRSAARIIKNYVTLRFKKKIKLNLGAGGTRMADYINVDSLFMRETDLLCELHRMPYFIKKGSVTHIYASHIFEHFDMREVKKLFRMAAGLLEKGGELRISVPDFDKITTLYAAKKEEFRNKDPKTWLGVVYGGQSSRYDYHKIGYNEHLLSSLLRESGFSVIKQYDAEAFLSPYGIRDSSLYKKDFGQYISLNVVAYK